MEELKASIQALEKAMGLRDKATKDDFIFGGVSKSFEVCFEYVWKYFKMRLEKDGIESYSPRDTLKHAGRLNWIDDVEEWLDFLENRNMAVHGYYGITKKDYLDMMDRFLKKVKKLQLIKV